MEIDYNKTKESSMFKTFEIPLSLYTNLELELKKKTEKNCK